MSFGSTKNLLTSIRFRNAIAYRNSAHLLLSNFYGTLLKVLNGTHGEKTYTFIASEPVMFIIRDELDLAGFRYNTSDLDKTVINVILSE